jgi:hypothetical protein
MKVAIYSRGFDLDQRQSLNALLLELHKHDVAICIFHDLLQKFELCAPIGKEAYIPFTSAYDLPENIDCLISLGGLMDCLKPAFASHLRVQKSRNHTQGVVRWG